VRVLVTGHLGYLGTVVVPALQARGVEVVGLDSGLFAECRLGPPTSSPEREYLVDLRDAEPSVCQGVDAVVHLAALSNDPLGNLDADLTYDINVDATLRLARMARDAGVQRFVFSSSCSIYGAAGDDLVTEDAPMRPVTPYAESKVRAEDGLHELADAAFSPVSLRNATAYGWSPRLRLDVVLNDLVTGALLTGEVRVLSDGSPWRPIVHAQDIASVVAETLVAPREVVHDAVFNVGFASENYRVLELAEIAAALVADSRIMVTGETGPDPRSYRVDFSRLARAFPALAPLWDARGGSRDLLARLREYGMGAVDRPRFNRLAWLTSLRNEERLTPSLRWAASPAR
jgi:nucleoside-diphosphate-sugar epimerase